MTHILISRTLLVLMLGSSLISTNVFAEMTTDQQSVFSVDSIGKKFDSSMGQIGGFVDDSALTTRVKAGLIDQKNIKSTDISVSTEDKVVTLSGFVRSQNEAELAVKVAQQVAGVSSVNDKLHITESEHKSVLASANEYTGDTVITSKVKAKLLSELGIVSRHIRVQTANGVVQLTGEVPSHAKAADAESIVKTLDGVKSVKNDLQISQ